MKLKYILTIITGCLAMLATSCEKKGPAEKAGEKVDDAAEKTKDKAKEMKEGAKDAAEKAGDKIEDATDN